MSNENIIIRRAKVSDSYDIWRLSQAEGYQLSRSYILNNIDNLYVLIHRKRILGVLCGTPNAEMEVSWVAIHPMYPESSLGAAMINSIRGVFFRQPLQNYQRVIKLPALRQFLDKILSYIKFRGVINGISGKQEF